MSISQSRKVAQRFAAQKVADSEIQKRIQAIPGWDRSNFLQSLYRQVGRSPLSPKQMAVLEKIEKEQGSGGAPKAGPAAKADVVVKSWLDHGVLMAIVDQFRKKGVVTVSDPKGLVAGEPKYPAAIVKQLVFDFEGGAEQYHENNADVTDSRDYDRNSMYADAYSDAAVDMQRAKLHVKRDSAITTLTLTPSYQDIMKKHISKLPR